MSNEQKANPNPGPGRVQSVEDAFAGRFPDLPSPEVPATIDEQLFVDLFAETGQQAATIAMMQSAMESALECISEGYEGSAMIILRETLERLGKPARD